MSNSVSPVVSQSWLKSWEVALALVLLVAAWNVPSFTHQLGWGDLALWFGGIVLGTGLLRDLWALLVTRPKNGSVEVAMCVESIIGVAFIAVGLALIVVPFLLPSLASSPPRLSGHALSLLLAFALIFSAWVHDLVIVKRDGRTRLIRHRDHGSFVVHLFQGRTKECAMGPANSKPAAH
jgi:hypothetical protein